MKHGHRVGKRFSPTYNSWRAMLQRCTDPKHREYPRYGGAGVQIVARWRKFENFLQDMGPRPAGTTLGRVAPFADYGPGQVEWQTIYEQNRAVAAVRSCCIRVYRGLTYSEWADKLGIQYRTLLRRIQRGWGDQAFRVHRGMYR